MDGLANGLISTLLSIALCGIVPLTVYVTVPYATDAAVPLEVGMALFLVILSGARLSFVIGSGRQALFSFAFWLFVYVFMSLPAFAQVLTRRYPYTTPDIQQEYAPLALAVVILGTVCAMAGAAMVRRPATGAASPNGKPEGEPARHPRLLNRTRITLLTLAGFAAWTYYVARIGPSTFISSREEIDFVRGGAFPDPTTATIIASAASLPLLVCVHAMHLYRRAERKLTGAARSFTLMLPLAAIAVVFAINIFTSSRYIFGTMAFSLLVLGGGFATRRRARFSMASLVFLLIAAFPLFSMFRRATTRDTTELGAAAFVNSGDYDSFAQIINSVQYVSTEGIVWGKQLLGPLVFWVPRSVWPDKPIDTGVLIAQFRGYRFENLSAPFWAEAFLSGGWAGVVVLFLALGYALRRSDLAVGASLDRAGLAGISAAILSFYMLILLRGSLLQATSTLAVIVLSIFIVASREKPPATVTAPRAITAAGPEPHRRFGS